ncbi:sigma-70 family RNA polymerase sigma factor [Shewanella gelidimarina]|uniref:RNA polymerase sigma factor n=1 Tax=Shewanella gelidimarina TaxID=56813 RepID=UPI00200E8F2B|nr:sigma-70 family RNA polymerase sigma factor [Shewanella gelidimarina]MCL1059411.1 sigma-70 family RNA polymerase sigma factor [Shewanella gelidimarina]
MMDRELLQSLYRYCLCLTRHNAQAEDLLQTAIERWLKSEAKPEHLRAYLRTVIRHQFIDDCRRLKIIDFEPIDDHDPALLDETCLEEVELQHDLIEYLFSQLNAAEREVLYLWAVEGYSAAEIAKDLGQPRGTILSRLHRIKIKSVDIMQLSAQTNTTGQGG